MIAENEVGQSEPCEVQQPITAKLPYGKMLFKCYVAFFSWKIDTATTCNTNNVEPYTSVTLFLWKFDTRYSPLRYAPKFVYLDVLQLITFHSHLLAWQKPFDFALSVAHSSHLQCFLVLNKFLTVSLSMSTLHGLPLGCFPIFISTTDLIFYISYLLSMSVRQASILDQHSVTLEYHMHED